VMEINGIIEHSYVHKLGNWIFKISCLYLEIISFI
jgi:hypothetical protein